MCRWLAYIGPSIFLDTVLIKPQHSLIDQSLHAQFNYVPGVGKLPTNGDGFGIGWYGERAWPGLYKDIRPAWNDVNLRCLTEQVRAPLFLAHVRAASPHTDIQRTNCHPFQYNGWLFQHNGEIAGFQEISRELRCEVAPEFYPHMRGNTDSETCFHLALTYGLQENPLEGLRRMVGRVEKARETAGIEAPFRLTCAITDGRLIYALRYSSDQQSKSLFYSHDIEAIRELDGSYEEFPEEARLIVSEPLDDLSDNWVEVPESTLIVADRDQIEMVSFRVP
jgi:glutamine amidotransferase